MKKPKVTVTITVENVLNMARTALKKRGETVNPFDFSNEQAKAFFTLHGEALTDKINGAVRDFITDKLCA